MIWEDQFKVPPRAHSRVKHTHTQTHTWLNMTQENGYLSSVVQAGKSGTKERKPSNQSLTFSKVQHGRWSLPVLTPEDQDQASQQQKINFHNILRLSKTEKICCGWLKPGHMRRACATCPKQPVYTIAADNLQISKQMLTLNRSTKMISVFFL